LLKINYTLIYKLIFIKFYLTIFIYEYNVFNY